MNHIESEPYWLDSTPSLVAYKAEPNLSPCAETVDSVLQALTDQYKNGWCSSNVNQFFLPEMHQSEETIPQTTYRHWMEARHRPSATRPGDERPALWAKPMDYQYQ
ncbi:hypothetical protein RRG08_055567, partial [Elysia crispata]